ncbi:MAG: hypothetical protein MJE66_06280 [Proteobacteria bacterium]|nr:hypothetical protein [Pseudomonadota bacterium]
MDPDGTARADLAPERRIPRLFLRLSLGFQLLLLTALVVRIAQLAPKIAGAMEDFGGRLPAATAAFLTAPPYLVAWVALMGAFVIDVCRRADARDRYAIAVFVALTVSAQGLLGWLGLAMYLPMRRIADAIG